MQRNLRWIALGVAFLGAAIGLLVDFGGRQVPPEPLSTTEPVEVPAAELDEASERLRQLDGDIAFYTRRGEEGASWADYELAALRYLERQRLTGSYDDFAGAERVLQAAFALAPVGSGPLFTRMQLNFTLHRLAPLALDVEALRDQPLLRGDQLEALSRYRAEIAFYSGHYDDALSRYEALLLEARSTENLVSVAQYRWRTGDLSAADALLTEAESTAPSDSRPWLHLVRALFEISREHWDDALASLEQGLELEPGWWQLEEHMAQVLFEQDALEDARLLYESVYARTPSPEILDALAILADEQGRRDDATELAARAEALHEERVALFPEAAAGHAVDHFLLLSDDLDRAIELATINRDARPFGEAQAKLAIAYARAGRWDDALEVVYLLEATPWSTAESRAISALVHEQVGDAARAAEHRAAALALSPGAIDRVTATLRGR
jgi:predicted Zn-dependent protease